MEVRLQKILSQWGITSRRRAEGLIQDGYVCVNGRVAQLGHKADPATDRIMVHGVPLQGTHQPQRRYILIHKPPGFVCTCTDPQGRPTVMDLLPHRWRSHQGLHPVGRLDANSTGALLLSNDGQLTFQLTHPRHHIPKVYQVEVQGHPPQAVLQRWEQGIMLGKQRTLPAQVRVLEYSPNGYTWLEISLHEGRNRQIRRVGRELGFPVVRLHRIAIGSLALGQLPRGQYRQLQSWEVGQLKQLAILLIEPPVKHKGRL